MKRARIPFSAAVGMILTIGVFLLFPILGAEDNTNLLNRWVMDVVQIMEGGYSENSGNLLRNPLLRYAVTFVGVAVGLLFAYYLILRFLTLVFGGKWEEIRAGLARGARFLYGFLDEADRMIVLLRLCALCLATVSFWATAQGMAGFVFTEKWQAYLASLAIQGILLVMSFLLPQFLWGGEKSLRRRVQIGIVIPLTAVVLCISSGFSYIYITQYIYKDSWDGESLLLVQNAYREELYRTQDYVTLYERYLEEEVKDTLLVLYEEAAGIEKEREGASTAPDFAAERANYVHEAVRSPMADAIDAVEKALQEDAAPEDLQSAAGVLERMEEILRNAGATAQSNYDAASASYDTAQANLSAAQTNLRYAQKNGQDTEELLRNVERWNGRIELYSDRMDQYWEERTIIADALDRIAYYRGVLAGSGRDSYNRILDSLKAIQKELFRDEPSADLMIAETVELFDGFEENMQQSHRGEAVQFAGRLNEFLTLLEDYRAVKELSAELDGLYGNAAQEQSAEIGGRSRQEWILELERLKDVIARVPVRYAAEVEGGKGYAVEAEAGKGHGAEVKARKSDAADAYSRMRSTERLNDVIRRYLTGHNPADQAILYLESPYRGLAVFALILAFFLDLASFTAGIAAQMQTSSEE